MGKVIRIFMKNDEEEEKIYDVEKISVFRDGSNIILFQLSTDISLCAGKYEGAR